MQASCSDSLSFQEKGFALLTQIHNDDRFGEIRHH